MSSLAISRVRYNNLIHHACSKPNAMALISMGPVFKDKLGFIYLCSISNYEVFIEHLEGYDTHKEYSGYVFDFNDKKKYSVCIRVHVDKWGNISDIEVDAA